LEIFPARTPCRPCPRPGQARRSSAPRLTAWEILQTIHFGGTPELNLISTPTDGTEHSAGRTGIHRRQHANTLGPIRPSLSARRLRPIAQLRPHALFSRPLAGPRCGHAWAASRDLSASIDFSREAETNFSALSTSPAMKSARPGLRLPAAIGSAWPTCEWDGTTTLPSPKIYAGRSFNGTLNATETESGWGSVEAASLVLQTRRTNDSVSGRSSLGPVESNQALDIGLAGGRTNIRHAQIEIGSRGHRRRLASAQLTIDKIGSRHVPRPSQRRRRRWTSLPAKCKPAPRLISIPTRLRPC
jgi:hypothetical protein